MSSRFDFDAAFMVGLRAARLTTGGSAAFLEASRMLAWFLRQVEA
jgi:hypothetical protein